MSIFARFVWVVFFDAHRVLTPEIDLSACLIVTTPEKKPILVLMMATTYFVLDEISGPDRLAGQRRS